MEKYEPLVTCQDVGQQPAPSYDSCKEIIDKMPWSSTKTLFGTAGQPGVEVIVPETLKSSKHSIVMLDGFDKINNLLQVTDAVTFLFMVPPRL